MTFRVLRSLIFAATLGLLAAGCVDSEQPLGARTDARADPRLVGTWHLENADKPVDPADKSAGRITFDEHGIGRFEDVGMEEGKSKQDPMDFFVTRTERLSFLNVLNPGTPTAAHPQPPKTYVLLKYIVSPDGKSVELWMLRAETLKPPINAGKLKGYINKDSDHSLADGVTLQDSAENILKFIESNPEKEVFEKFGTLRKLD